MKQEYLKTRDPNLTDDWGTVIVDHDNNYHCYREVMSYDEAEKQIKSEYGNEWDDELYVFDTTSSGYSVTQQ